MMPISYKMQSGMASANCDATSGGVTTAAAMKAPTITYRRTSVNVLIETNPVATNTTTTMGVSNATPKAMNIPKIKLK